jgi:MFS family permease
LAQRAVDTPPAPTAVAAVQAVPELLLEEKRPWYLPRTFDAFRFGPFRWYMGAMIWWNAAMSMQMLVRAYLAYNLTEDFRALGVVGLGSAIPMLLLSPFGGVIADRTSKRLVLQIGQAFSLVIAVVVAALLFADMLSFWHLFLASVAQGLMMALVMPSRQALLPEVVGLKRLMNAIPLQSAGMNLMQIMAPTLGGFMIDWIGPGSVYAFMAAMYFMSVVMLFGVKTLSAEEQEAARTGTAAASANGRGPRGPVRRGGTFSELKGGFSYLFKDHTVLSILAFAFLGSVLGMPIRMLLAGYVAAVFDDSGTTLGLLQMGMGVGALLGALGLASLRMDSHRGLLLACSSGLMGLAMLGFSTTELVVLAWVGLFVIGVGSAGRQALSQVLVQEYVDDQYRGRVMSIFMMQFSIMSLGVFIVSLYMEAVGPEFAIGSLGVVLMAAVAIYLLLVPRFRRLA